MDAGQVHTLLGSVGQPKRNGSTDAERHVVLRYLVILRHVRIEVVLAVELREGRDLGAEGEPGFDEELDCDPVGNWQRARKSQADGTDVGVGLRPEEVAAPAEHLGLGFELDVAFDADHGFERNSVDFQVLHGTGNDGRHRALASSTGGTRWAACCVPDSYARATPMSRRSAKSGAVSSSPSGKGLSLPCGVT